MSITTKRGDRGFTDLLFGGKVAKGDPQIEALGTVDELNANLGMAFAKGQKMRHAEVDGRRRFWSRGPNGKDDGGDLTDDVVFVR